MPHNIPAAHRPEYITAAEAAAILGVHPATVRRLIRRGELKARRIGRAVRIRLDDIDRAGRAAESVRRSEAA